MSGRVSWSKSIVGMNELRPRDSFTAAVRISKISVSFSNFTSVFAGCMLTFRGGLEKNVVRRICSFRYQFVIGLHDGLMEI